MSYIITSDALPARLTLVERAHGAAGPPFGRYTFHDDGGVEVEAYRGGYLSDSVTQPDPERWRTFVTMPYRALA
jgi:hypothetical protein